MAVVSLLAAVVAFRRPRLRIDTITAWRRPGVLGTFGYRLVFSLGASVAPLLLLLTIAVAEGRPEQGLLAFIFGLGRGLPFLLVGMAGSAVAGFARLGLWSRSNS